MTELNGTLGVKMLKNILIIILPPKMKSTKLIQEGEGGVSNTFTVPCSNCGTSFKI